MKLTRSVSYAVSVLLRIAGHPQGQPLTAAAISKGCRFPPRFLYRVLRRLVDSRLLTAVSGPGGGYALARTPRKINLLQIVGAVEGDHEPSELSPVTPRHRRAIQCINALNRRQLARFDKELAKVTLAQLALMETGSQRTSGMQRKQAKKS